MRRKWRLIRYDITNNWREVPPGKVDKEQLFWWKNSALRAEARLNYFHYAWGSKYRFEAAPRKFDKPSSLVAGRSSR